MEIDVICKYFYYCPMKAGIMYQDFDVVILDRYGKPFESLDDIFEGELGYSDRRPKDGIYYVSPKSEHIFEPLPRDVDKKGMAYHKLSSSLDEKNFITYIRDGKHFFMPEVYEEDENDN